MIEAIGVAFVNVFGFPNVLVVLFGTTVSMLFGALPGLGGIVILTLSLPIIMALEPALAMMVFAASIGGITFGGSVSAILLNVPGTVANIATVFDGHPLARQGRAGYALAISATASALGSVFGYVVFLLLLPVVRSVVFSFGPPEFFLMALLGISLIASLTQKEPVKGLISAGLGFLVAFIGYSPITGDQRYTFDLLYLWDGVHTGVIAIGIFAVSEMFFLAVKGEELVQQTEVVRPTARDVFDGIRFVFANFFLLLRSAVIGCVVGIIPGVGANVAAFLAYAQAQATSPNRANFGRGAPEGVLAPEAANDAKDGGALLPTVAFGIPGSAPHAILLVGLLLLGLNPGKELLTTHQATVFTLVLALIAANVWTSILGLIFANHLVKITRIRVSLIIPIVLVISFVGAFVLRNNLLDAFAVLVFGFIGYGMKKYSYSFITFILAYVLGEIAEVSLFQTLLISDTGFLIFVTRPVSLVLTLLIAMALALPLAAPLKRAWQRRQLPDAS